ncbi:tail fiber protein [Belliella marina]|uniref:Tail fiber protein n=1 Tax=Belliella marina TaxID=1644146 RepID=A0ABW4VNB1_9BACT
MVKTVLTFLLVMMSASGLLAQSFPTETSRGDVVETYVNSNNAIEIGLANSLNARRAWILSRHNTTSVYGDYYSTFHLQPDIGDKSRYRGVAIGHPASTILPVGVHLAVNGRVGIGIINPSVELHVKGTVMVDGQFSVKSDDGNTAGYIGTTGDAGTANGVNISSNRGNGKIVFSTLGGNLQEKMRITNTGNVGIGTTIPTNKLEVNGTIRAKEVKLEATNWPDYVFEKGYELMPLKEVDAFIGENGHLPGLKSAKEYAEEGVDMLELNQKLLEKVEELTLHLIEQEKRIKQLERQQQK